MTFTAPVIDRLIKDIKDSISQASNKKEVIPDTKSKKRKMEKTHPSPISGHSIKETSALKEPTRVFKMPTKP
jgi:uracil DNA glycosylase